MRNYFEYFFDDSVRSMLINYYERLESVSKTSMRGSHHMLKIKLKIKRMMKRISINPNDIILDVGCSEGGFLFELANCYKRGVGLDISDTLIIRNNERAAELMQSENLQFKYFDGINIGFEDTFDKVVMFDVLEHVFDPDQLINSIYNSLKKGGVLVIQVPTSGWLSEMIFGKYHEGHLRYYDDIYMSKYLEKFGFEVMVIDVYNSVPFASHFLRFPKIYNLLNIICGIIPPRMFPYFGSIMAFSKKP